MTNNKFREASAKRRSLQKRGEKLSFLIFIKEWEDFRPNCTLDGESKRRLVSQVFGNCKSWWKYAFYFGLQCCSLLCCLAVLGVVPNTSRYLSFSYFWHSSFFLSFFLFQFIQHKWALSKKWNAEGTLHMTAESPRFSFPGRFSRKKVESLFYTILKKYIYYDVI